MSRKLTQAQIDLIKATVPALEQHGETIAKTMYKRLFKTPHIAALFNQSNQKKGSQPQALAGAVLAYAKNIDNLGALGPAVERMAQKHIGYAILPEHYPFVAEALLGAIGEVLGDAATPEIIDAWGEAYWMLADILIGREAAIREEITAQPGGWTDWRKFVIAERRDESETITSFMLRPADGGRVVRHRPGQYLTLRFDLAGMNGVKRNFSVSSAPNDEFYRITVKREPEGEASIFLHDKAEVGTVLETTPPAGDFYLPEDPQRPVILLSGGVGLTPMISMMKKIVRERPDLPTYYIHGTKSSATHALDAEVREIAGQNEQIKIATFYEEGATDDVVAGLISVDWLRANTPLDQADIYICGPKPFLRHFVNGLVKEGIASDRIHYEFFGPADEALAA